MMRFLVLRIAPGIEIDDGDQELADRTDEVSWNIASFDGSELIALFRLPMGSIGILRLMLLCQAWPEYNSHRVFARCRCHF
jgi:hypothetical protein